MSELIDVVDDEWQVHCNPMGIIWEIHIFDKAKDVDQWIAAQYEGFREKAQVQVRHVIFHRHRR